MRRLALVGASLVLVGGLAACGGSPDDASKDDFCKAADKVFKSVGEEDFDKYKDAVEDFKDVGTPDGIPDDARKGFEFIIDEVGDADNEKDLEDVDPSDDEDKQTEAFGKYYSKTCS